jgi:Rad3-related DNA helicase
MPYNYLVDPEIRFYLGFDLNNAVIIFDEAHNVPSAQEDVSSFEVREDMLLKTLSELRYL